VDLLQITRKVWVHRLVALPVIALTVIGAFYVLAIKKPTYEVSSSYVLINPPDPPTAEEIASNPKLKGLNSDNPYTRFADQSAMIGLLSSRVGAESVRQSLSEQGADPDYRVGPSPDIGYGSFLLEITGVGSSPEGAVRTAQLVGGALTTELQRMQASQGVVPQYMIQAQLVVAPDHALQRVSGKLRPLIGVLVIGAILLFVVISAAEALASIRTDWSGARAREAKNGREPDWETAVRENGGEPARESPIRENGDEPARAKAENGSRSRKKRRRGRGKRTGSKA
jgi:hypothetical protein